jgi:hypothetical protein
MQKQWHGAIGIHPQIVIRLYRLRAHAYGFMSGAGPHQDDMVCQRARTWEVVELHGIGSIDDSSNTKLLGSVGLLVRRFAVLLIGIPRRHRADVGCPVHERMESARPVTASSTT